MTLSLTPRRSAGTSTLERVRCRWFSTVTARSKNVSDALRTAVAEIPSSAPGAAVYFSVSFAVRTSQRYEKRAAPVRENEQPPM